ncbi:di-N-acetylchitobiase-like isoform X2 [Leucoraja erinacea]|uniref:di-N-acetylchitobiase-like isoform X2 n=1 Tax=Leucoraja erinaceus TaxID=7782 RepID=UPI002455F784|nr:di-N-acetylchitobiase-like isoform X2 [Leucoraja erinacea]
MRWILESALTLVINTLWMQNIVTVKDPCKCRDQTLCKPISSSHRTEVFAFHLDQHDWAQYQWSKITTIVVSGDVEAKFYCIAHSHNIRLVLKDITMSQLRNDATMKRHLFMAVWSVEKYSLDGIYMLFSSKLKKGSTNYHDFTRMVNKTASKFYKTLPGSKITINVPWTPSCKNERCFDFLAISSVIDLLFVESFNIHKGMKETCVAKSISSYHDVFAGLSDYIKLGIESRKLVMGVPWYGYDYTCKRIPQDGVCELNCSHPVKKLIPYKTIIQHLPRSMTGKVWNDDQSAPYAVYMDGKSYHQIWYDDPESISMKSTLLKRFKLGGIGVMQLTDVDHSRTAWAMLHAEEMWNALCPP